MEPAERRDAAGGGGAELVARGHEHVSQPGSCDVQPRPSAHDVPSGQSEAGSPQAPLPVHATLHAHDCEHFVCLWHEKSPLHVTVHGPVLHWMTSPHEYGPVHCTSHDVDRPHCT